MRYEYQSLTTSILIAGLGGQGILHLSKVLTSAAKRKFNCVCRSEFRGLSQRGGSVQSIVRFGHYPVAPILDFHCADLVLAMDALEAVRASDFLHEKGCLVTDSGVIPPLHVMRSWEGRGEMAHLFDADLRERLDAHAHCMQLDLVHLAKEAGDVRSANTVLLGAASWVMPFTREEIHEAIEACVRRSLLAVNLAAFESGRHAVRLQAPLYRLEDAQAFSHVTALAGKEA